MDGPKRISRKTFLAKFDFRKSGGHASLDPLCRGPVFRNLVGIYRFEKKFKKYSEEINPIEI